MQLPSEIQMISAELRFGGFPVRWPDLSIVAFIILFFFFTFEAHPKFTSNNHRESLCLTANATGID